MALISVNQVAFAAFLGTLAFSAGAWVVNYFFRGENFAKRYLDKLSALRRRAKREEADQLAIQCSRVGFDEGAKEALELKAAFGKLHQTLSRHKNDLNSQRFQVLAEDTYYEGLRLLRAALDTFKIVDNIDIEQLLAERDQWITQRNQLEGETQEDLLRALTTKIDSHDRRLELHSDRKNQLEQLLAECEVLEAALDAAYMESVDLVGPDSEVARGDHGRELERAVAAARKVEERLRGSSGVGATDHDQMYAEAGQKAKD